MLIFYPGKITPETGSIENVSSSYKSISSATAFLIIAYFLERRSSAFFYLFTILILSSSYSDPSSPSPSN
jgi:hypothetical protein